MIKPKIARKRDALVSSGVRESTATNPRYRRGNRGTRRDKIPLNKVTVCAGTSWLKATRKEICTGIVPAIVVKVHLSFRVNVKSETRAKKVSIFGTRDTTKRNLANSLEDHALSRYLPPWYRVSPAMDRVKILFSTSVDVTKVQG